MRTVSIKYLVPVYCTVDLDAEPYTDHLYDGTPVTRYEDDAIVKVFEGVESIVRLDALEDKRVRKGYLDDYDPFETSYDDEAVDPTTLSPEDRAKALDIAESTGWPIWES